MRATQQPRPRLALWCLAAGVILAMADVICAALGAISNQQAMALGLAAALLIIAGLIAAAVPDPETGQRHAFLAGFHVGALLSRLRSAFRRPDNGD